MHVIYVILQLSCQSRQTAVKYGFILDSVSLAVFVHEMQPSVEWPCIRMHVQTHIHTQTLCSPPKSLCLLIYTYVCIYIVLIYMYIVLICVYSALPPLWVNLRLLWWSCY